MTLGRAVYISGRRRRDRGGQQHFHADIIEPEAPVTCSREWWEDLPAFDMTGIKPFDTTELATLDDILPPAERVEAARIQ